jgi:hypothetical protein
MHAMNVRTKPPGATLLRVLDLIKSGSDRLVDERQYIVVPELIPAHQVKQRPVMSHHSVS